jgi:hypothetical protein
LLALGVRGQYELLQARHVRFHGPEITPPNYRRNGSRVKINFIKSEWNATALVAETVHLLTRYPKLIPLTSNCRVPKQNFFGNVERRVVHPQLNSFIYKNDLVKLMTQRHSRISRLADVAFPPTERGRPSVVCSRSSPRTPALCPRFATTPRGVTGATRVRIEPLLLLP